MEYWDVVWKCYEAPLCGQSCFLISLVEGDRKSSECYGAGWVSTENMNTWEEARVADAEAKHRAFCLDILNNS